MAIVLNFVRSICGFLFLLLFFKIHETISLQRLNTPENTPCAWHSSPIQNGGRKWAWFWKESNNQRQLQFFSNPSENVRQPKALPDTDMLLFYTIHHNREILTIH